ncbi:MAG: metal ABC transporter permease [Gemmatimonadaceae bacterium]|nr:metal ABC transporter permease [Gemmatimonadaceae bacterium]
MDAGRLLHDLFFDYTLRTVALGAMALGVVSGTLGAFAVLRRQSLLGDAISHAALPGIVLAFMFTGAKDPLWLVVGAAVAGWLGALTVMWIVRQSRLPEDTALGIVLSVFFGIGLVLLTYVQREPTASQAGLNTFLFGQAATLVVDDVIVIAVLGSVALGVVALFWKEFKLLSFDREFGKSLGIGMRGIDVLLTTVLVIAIVIGLQTVGVVLMSAMVVAPAAAARQWTDSLGVMVVLSAVFGALGGVTGAVASSTAAGIPTGPAIVLAVTMVVVLSIALAPRRGLVWEWVRHKRNQQTVRTGAVLTDLYALASHHKERGHGHKLAVLQAMDARRGGVRRTLDVLASRGLAARAADDTWSLTEQGEQEARAEIARREGDDA